MKLHVVTCVSNPVRYQSRYRLYRDFARHMRASGVLLYTAECAFGARPFEATDAANPRHLQLRTGCEMWHKENLLNLMIARLPSDWEYVAWIDADVVFARPDWAAEAVQQLQHYDIVQLFSEAHDLGPDHHVFARYRSFAHSYSEGVPRLQGAGYYGGAPPQRDTGITYYHHPGYAWAMRRSAFDAVGGLLDVAVVGEADWIMARALLGEAEQVLYPGISAGYRRAILEWQGRAVRHLRANLGCVAGTLLHAWHGPKANRNYWNRCRILVESGFDPEQHLKRDWQGLYQLVDRGDPASLHLRDGLRRYFRSRNEDATQLS
jgi:hypothetical protein